MGCFRELLSDVGTLVEVDEATLNWECVEFARLKVRLVVSSTVNFSKEIMINDKVYQVFVEEEHSYEDFLKHSRGYLDGAVDDSLSSLDSRVRETILSGNNGWEEKEDERFLEEEKEGCRNQCLSDKWDKQVVEGTQCQTSTPRKFNVGDFRITFSPSVAINDTLDEEDLWGAQRVEELHSPSLSGQLFNADVILACKRGICGNTLWEISEGVNVGAAVGFCNEPQAQSFSAENPSPHSPLDGDLRVLLKDGGAAAFDSACLWDVGGVCGAGGMGGVGGVASPTVGGVARDGVGVGDGGVGDVGSLDAAAAGVVGGFYGDGG